MDIGGVMLTEARLIETASELTVLLADDQRCHPRRRPAARSSRMGCESWPRWVTPRTPFAAALELRPDVCLLAVRMPGNGIEAARQISDALPRDEDRDAHRL